MATIEVQNDSVNHTSPNNMTQREKWRDEIIAILKDLGGKAPLSRIYPAVEKRGNMDISSPHWNSRIRDTLEVYSSDSAIFNGVEDIFYSVAGIRKGIWGLRSYIIATSKPIDFPDPPEVSRVVQEIYRILRDTELSRFVKSIYEGVCQLCGTFIELPNGSRYAEAHHIKPLGRPHSGPDVKGNIICLCPICHVKMDYGLLFFDLNKLTLHEKHKINVEYVDYHNKNILKK
jgi:hypothetical protein